MAVWLRMASLTQRVAVSRPVAVVIMRKWPAGGSSSGRFPPSQSLRAAAAELLKGVFGSWEISLLLQSMGRSQSPGQARVKRLHPLVEETAKTLQPFLPSTTRSRTGIALQLHIAAEGHPPGGLPRTSSSSQAARGPFLCHLTGPAGPQHTRWVEVG